MSKNYLDENLSKMYLLESERKKLEEMVAEKLERGESLTSPDLLRQEAIIHEMINRQMLEELEDSLEKKAEEDL